MNFYVREAGQWMTIILVWYAVIVPFWDWLEGKYDTLATKYKMRDEKRENRSK